MTPAHPSSRMVWLAAAIFVLGCSSQAEKLDRSARTAHSWTATARKTSQALAAGSVPRVYARQVLDDALESKRELARQPEWRLLDRSSRGQLETAIQELASSLDGRPDSLPRP